MDPGVGVGRAANPALHRFVIREGVAIGAEQRPARGAFQFPFVGTGPALPEIATAVVDVEAADHAVAVEGDVIAEARRKLGIGLHPEERAVQFPGNCALVREIYNVRFDARGRVEVRESGCLGKMSHDTSRRRRSL